MGIFRRQRSRLLAGWAGYWILLAGTTLWKPLAIMASWSGLPEGSGTASASGGYSDGRLVAELLRNSEKVWTGSISLITFALLVAGPPLVMLWLYLRERAPDTAPPVALGAGTSPMQPLDVREPSRVRRD